MYCITLVLNNPEGLESPGVVGLDEVDVLDALGLGKPLRVGQDIVLKI